MTCFYQYHTLRYLLSQRSIWHCQERMNTVPNPTKWSPKMVGLSEMILRLRCLWRWMNIWRTYTERLRYVKQNRLNSEGKLRIWNVCALKSCTINSQFIEFIITFRVEGVVEKIEDSVTLGTHNDKVQEEPKPAIEIAYVMNSSEPLIAANVDDCLIYLNRRIEKSEAKKVKSENRTSRLRRKCINSRFESNIFCILCIQYFQFKGYVDMAESVKCSTNPKRSKMTEDNWNCNQYFNNIHLLVSFIHLRSSFEFRWNKNSNLQEIEFILIYFGLVTQAHLHFFIVVETSSNGNVILLCMFFWCIFTFDELYSSIALRDLSCVLHNV